MTRSPSATPVQKLLTLALALLVVVGGLGSLEAPQAAPAAQTLHRSPRPELRGAARPTLRYLNQHSGGGRLPHS
ncbi:MAG: hypothetical protein ACOVNL_13720 [Prochlorococcaceae cyanobacterium]